MEILIAISVIILVLLFSFIKLYEFKTRDKVKASENNKTAPKVKKARSSAHKDLIGKTYKLQCKSDVFTHEELEVLYNYGAWLSALASNKIEPETQEQADFVRNCQEFRLLSLFEMSSYYQGVPCDDAIQATWFKYICRIKFERENPKLLSRASSVDWGWHGPPISSGGSVFFSK
jgi:uncharacterized protein YifE (UPF0438 family)